MTTRSKAAAAALAVLGGGLAALLSLGPGAPPPPAEVEAAAETLAEATAERLPAGSALPRLAARPARGPEAARAVRGGRPGLGAEALARIAARTDAAGAAARARATRATERTERPAAALPAQYLGAGLYDGYADELDLAPYARAATPPVVVYRDLGPDWRARARGSLALARRGVAVFDYDVGGFDGPTVEAFVAEVRPPEVALGWKHANAENHAGSLDELAADVRGAVEHVKRARPETWVWVTAMAATPAADAWLARIPGTGADGVVVWNVYGVPADWRETGFYERLLDWAEGPGLPAAFGSLYGGRLWEGRDGPAARTATDGHGRARALAEARVRAAAPALLAMGWTAAWVQMGDLPDAAYGVAW